MPSFTPGPFGLFLDISLNSAIIEAWKERGFYGGMLLCSLEGRVDEDGDYA